MFSEDDLDSILFGKPGDLSADEFKYFDTPGIGITDAALPFHDESSLFFGNDQVASSSNCNVDLLGVDGNTFHLFVASHRGGLTLHADIIDRGTSSDMNTGSTPQDAPQPSTLPYDSSLNDTPGFNIPAVQPSPTPLLQNDTTSLEDPTGPTTERRGSPSSSAALKSCSTAQSNPSPNLDWNSIYLSLGLTSSHTFDPTNNPSYESVSSNTQTAVELPPTNDVFDAIQFPGFVDNNATPIPSYIQPTNSAIQPENHPLKPSSSLANTQRLVFSNVAQSSTSSSIQHYSSSPGVNVPPPQSIPAANVPHQHYPIPTPNENTPIPSQSRANQAPVNNLNPAFFSTPPQHGFNPGVQSHNISQRNTTNVPRQPSAAPLPPNGRQHLPGSIPTPQGQGPSANMPLNRQQMLPGPGNIAQNSVNLPMTPNYGASNSNTQQRVTPLNQDSRPRQMHNNVIVNNDSSVANNQRLIRLPTRISTTGYNGNSIVPNPQVPPTSGVPNVEPVNQQPLYPTPPTPAVVAQGGPHHPPSNNPRPHPIPPPLPTILDPTRPLPTRQPLIHPWTQQPVYIMSPPFPNPGRYLLPRCRLLPPPIWCQKRSRVDRPAEYLYEEIKKGKYACRYAGPAQPGGCKAPTFTSMSSLSTHIMLIHAKSETEMNLPVEQRTAYNGLPPNLRSVHVVCPLPDADLARCKHYHEHGRRWEAHVMDTPEHAVHSHIASNHV
ncbi:hypothetical protein Clacol_003353 [Clathrus columnatus]|uniref:Uncharacterized protein n=1 Tax=Clathrus columnatus TaxID=1419009 RepID=A0AAV5A7Z4_9AGAM|nr:hypothetical protein Clacol_003353 [Clathrus columnatus]